MSKVPSGKTAPGKIGLIAGMAISGERNFAVAFKYSPFPEISTLGKKMSFNFCWSNPFALDSKFCCSMAASLLIAASTNSLNEGAVCAEKDKGKPIIAVKINVL